MHLHISTHTHAHVYIAQTVSRVSAAHTPSIQLPHVKLVRAFARSLARNSTHTLTHCNNVGLVAHTHT